MIVVKVTHRALGVTVSASARVEPGAAGGLAETVRELNEALRGETAKKHARCALCSRALKEVALMVTSSNGSYICDDCVDHAGELVAEERIRKAKALEEQVDEPR